MLQVVIEKILTQANYGIVNFFRILLSLLFVYIVFPLEIRVYNYITVFHLLFSTIWFLLNQLNLIKISWSILGFIPQVLDILMVTIFVILTGHVNSFVSVGYVVIVVFSSIDLNPIYGKTSVILSILFFFGSGVLIIKNLIPVSNIFGYVTIIQWKGLIIATILIGFALSIVNQVISISMLKKSL